MKHCALTLLAAIVAILSGCASSTNAVFDSMRFVLKDAPDPAHAPLNPEFRYLRITTQGRTALIVLGYVEKDPQGPIEVWYSAQREVLRFQNGRLRGAAGLPTEWRNVQFKDLPEWQALARGAGQARWTRTRDVMPGYRHGMVDALVLRSVPPPPKSALRDVDPQSLAWFEEHIDPGPAGMPSIPEQALPVARYAVDLRQAGGVVLYGEQCLAPQFCFTWQRWPAARQNSQAAQR